MRSKGGPENSSTNSYAYVVQSYKMVHQHTDHMVSIVHSVHFSSSPTTTTTNDHIHMVLELCPKSGIFHLCKGTFSICQMTICIDWYSNR